MNIYIPYTRLPSAYQEVEYIQSSGTQYIDTGIKFTNNTTSDFDIAFTTNRSGWSGIIGAQYQNVNTSRAIGISETSFTYQQGSAFGDWTETPTLNQKYNFTNDATNVYVDGVVKKSISSGGTFTTPVNGTIFKVNYSSSTGFPYLVSAKLYKCELYESGTLVRDFVPCYRKQDGVIGLYDLVNSVFYTNAGTGTFSKGNDVTMLEAKNIYIGGGGWTPGSNTLAYYPFETDLKDYSGNGYDFTIYSGTTTFVDEMVQTDGVLRRGSLMSQLGNNFTISMYFLHAGDSCSLQDSDDMRYPTFIFGGKSDSISVDIWYNYNRYTTSYSLSPDYKIHHVVCTKENTTYKLYVDGELKSSNVYSYSLITDKAYFHLGNIGTSITKKFGNLILEKTVRTAQEVSDYYNQTKSNYGL